MASKTCFVTIGATASFTSLIKAVLEPSFIQALKSQGYTNLQIQYGEDGQPLFDDAVKKAGNSGIAIKGFGIDKAGLGKYMRQARDGVVVSHAGSGTIMEALRTAVPLIVVPNPDLLDNHQVELAEVLAEQEYVIHGHLNDLAKALGDAEELRQRQKEWPPVNAGVQRRGKMETGLKGILDEEMGFLD